MSAQLLFISKSVVQNENVVYLHLDRLIINIKYSSPHFLFIIYCLYRIATDIEIYEKIFFLFRLYYIRIYTFVL